MKASRSATLASAIAGAIKSGEISQIHLFGIFLDAFMLMDEKGQRDVFNIAREFVKHHKPEHLKTKPVRRYLRENPAGLRVVHSADAR